MITYAIEKLPLQGYLYVDCAVEILACFCLKSDATHNWYAMPCPAMFLSECMNRSLIEIRSPRYANVINGTARYLVLEASARAPRPSSEFRNLSYSDTRFLNMFVSHIA